MRGYTVGTSTVTQYVRQLRAEIRLAPARPSRPLAPVTPTPPTVRRLSVAVARHSDRRTDEERAWVLRLKELDSDVRQSLDVAEEFARLVRERNGVALDDWMNRLGAIPSLRAFAAGSRRDERRSEPGSPWSGVMDRWKEPGID